MTILNNIFCNIDCHDPDNLFHQIIEIQTFFQKRILPEYHKKTLTNKASSSSLKLVTFYSVTIEYGTFQAILG